MRKLAPYLLGLAVALVAALAPAIGPPAVIPTPAAAPTATPPPLPPCLEHEEPPAIVPLAGLRRPADYIALHHWGAPPPATVEVARAAFLSRKYADIAYNALFTANGATWAGRPESMASAATFGLNDRSVAGVLLGDFTRRPPPDAMLEAAGHWLVGALRRHPRARFIQHRDAPKVAHLAYGTACPGEAAVAGRTARIVWLLACGFKLPEARRRAAAGR